MPKEPHSPSLSAKRKLKGPERKQQIINSTIELIRLALGSDQEVARESRVNEALIFRHFKTKEGLLRAVVREVTGKRNEFRRDGNPRNQDRIPVDDPEVRHLLSEAERREPRVHQDSAAFDPGRLPDPPKNVAASSFVGGLIYHFLRIAIMNRQQADSETVGSAFALSF